MKHFNSSYLQSVDVPQHGRWEKQPQDPKGDPEQTTYLFTNMGGQEEIRLHISDRVSTWDSVTRQSFYVHFRWLLDTKYAENFRNNYGSREYYNTWDRTAPKAPILTALVDAKVIRPQDLKQEHVYLFRGNLQHIADIAAYGPTAEVIGYLWSQVTLQYVMHRFGVTTTNLAAMARKEPKWFTAHQCASLGFVMDANGSLLEMGPIMEAFGLNAYTFPHYRIAAEPKYMRMAREIRNTISSFQLGLTDTQALGLGLHTWSRKSHAGSRYIPKLAHLPNFYYPKPHFETRQWWREVDWKRVWESKKQDLMHLERWGGAGEALGV